jgi:hypothetical protein
MGAVISVTPSAPNADEEALTGSQNVEQKPALPDYFRYDRLPREASADPKEQIYADFAELFFAVPHRDGKSVIAFSHNDPDEECEDREFSLGNHYLRHTRHMFETLWGRTEEDWRRNSPPRIVR